MAAVNYASGRSIHMMAHDQYSSSSSSTGPTFFDLSDYMILQYLDDQLLGPSPPPAAGGGGVLVSDLEFGGTSSIAAAAQFATSSTASTAAAAAAAAGQFNYMTTSQLASSSSSNSTVEAGGGGGGIGFMRVAFRTKTEVDVLDDGFKWRKYGKKSVKNSPNPRNYYRCSTEGCSVKKRVERDRVDPSYVITTYDGVHNHTSADAVYYATQDTASGHFFVSGRYGDTTTPPNYLHQSLFPSLSSDD